VLEALRAGPAGQTEIGRRTGLLPHQVNKRLNDLKLAGMIELTGRRVEAGCEREWKATAASR
jgi:DNA-binding IclR family transcriptional regulator